LGDALGTSPGLDFGLHDPPLLSIFVKMGLKFAQDKPEGYTGP
jgi:hypothetical protein